MDLGSYVESCEAEGESGVKHFSEYSFFACNRWRGILPLRFSTRGHLGADDFLFGTCGSSVLHGGPIRNPLEGAEK